MTETTGKTVVWFRNDLRVHDNPALYQACQHDDPVIALFVCTPGQWREHDLSPHRLALTQAALSALQRALSELHIPLHVLVCDTFTDVPADILAFMQHHGAVELHANEEYAWDEARRDGRVAVLVNKLGGGFTLHPGSTIVPPGFVTTRTGDPYKVFTPFKKVWAQQHTYVDQAPLPKPAARSPTGSQESSQRSSADSAPLWSWPDVESGSVPITEWPTDEAQASARLDEFLQDSAHAYDRDRDVPALAATSRLSPCLTVGLLSPRQCLQRARQHNQGDLLDGDPGLSSWVNELVWRDFYLHVVHAFPQVSKYKAFRPETDRLRWRHDADDFAAWCTGRTGFPLVDAAMRQLNETGWMHNRLRMVTAMFLCKYLLLDWRMGERYFMQHLIDGHFPSNNGGWQWSASTGTDAAPYFRILSPVRQAERFDPNAEFIKRFIPELASVPAKSIHKPGHPDLLRAGYPPPIVDAKVARERCLAAFKALAC